MRRCVAISTTSPNQEGVEGTDSEEVWICTDPSAILVICASLRESVCFFLLKKAHVYLCSLQVSSSLRIPWAKRLPVEIQQNIDIESYRIKQTSKGKITLPRGTTEIEPIGPKEIYTLGHNELEPLSQIIQELNEHFGTDFTEDDKLCIREIEQRLAGNEALEASVRVNPPENARLTFDLVVNDLLQDMIDGHFKFYKQVNDDPEFAKTFLDWLFERYLGRSKKG